MFMMLKVINKTGFPKIDEAIKIFNSRTQSQLDLIYELPEKSYFTYTNDTTREAVRKINHFLAQDKTIEIQGYKTRWTWSSVIGYTYRGKYFINTRKINNLDVLTYAGNIFHEICHMKPLNYKHGSNYPSEEKSISVPYLFGYLLSSEMIISDFLKLSAKYKGV